MPGPPPPRYTGAPRGTAGTVPPPCQPDAGVAARDAEGAARKPPDAAPDAGARAKALPEPPWPTDGPEPPCFEAKKMIAATITTMNTTAKTVAARRPGVVPAPLMFRYRSAADCVPPPPRAASSGATSRGTSAGPPASPAGLYLNIKGAVT